MTFFAASVVANLSNFFFHVVMSRLLGPASYGALGSLLGIVTVVTLAVAALQAAITQTVAERRSSGNPGGDHLSLQTPFLRTALVAVACVVVIGVISPVLDSFLHLSSPTPVVFFGLFVALSVLALYPQGVLLGRLRFRTVAVALFAGAGMRFVSGVVFVEIGLGLNGAVVSSVVNGVVVLAILVWPLRHELFGRSGGVKLGLAFRTASLAVLALGGASAFVGVDSFLARHYLSRVASGYYVAGATAARIALFLPQAVTLLAFPRFAASRGSGVEARRLLTSALAAVAVLSGVAALVLLSIPHVVISILFGPRYTPAASVLGILSVAAAGVGMTSVLVYFHLARRSTLATASWLGVAVAAILISKWHSGMRSLAWIMLGVTATILLGLLAAALAQPARRRTQDITKSNLLRLTDTETMDLTVVVPYYNPGDRLRSTVEDLIRTLRAVGMSFEIITVSDGSTDGSEACLAGLDYEFLRSVKLKANQGKGEALRVGLAMGRGRYLGFIDGDGDLPGTQVASFVSLIRSHHPDII
ncbi:MAG: glycosyltransferase, partial [Acidimicrobiales bacterium]